ncbi:hypothetical protein HPB48_017264 [Haemaphysalis longicornis]|uniref:Uncharacterized protein n=1 Tax=Haemaphysalis longicornis TaxID=44386 RepID=A0A9J6FC13_HAELO|nr:hypothetical protein HPB48_017264 [Haemaphysalis longicornis]
MVDSGGLPCTYTLHGNVVAGVSWRPTRFTQSLPPLHVCSHCGVVPECTLVMPCLHVLCDLCLAGSTGGAIRDNVWQCPFDGHVYPVEDCREVQLPPLTAGDFQAYCWNEARGCTFVGDLPSMLHHFDHDCSFHAVSCPRCGVQVCAHGCSGASTSPDTTSNNADGQSSRYRALTLDDVAVAFQELKAALTSPAQQQLVAIQSQLGGLQQQCSEHTLNDRLEQVNSALASVATGDFLAHLRHTISGPVQAPNGETHSANGTPPIPWSVEKKHILRKLEMTSDDLLGCVRDDDPATMSLLVYPGVLGIVTLWHTRFTYCTVVLGTSKWEDKLNVYFKWANTVESPVAMPKNYSVTLVHRQDPRQNRAMEMDYRNNIFPMGCQHRFWTSLSAIQKSGLVHDSTLTFHVLIKHESR